MFGNDDLLGDLYGAVGVCANPSTGNPMPAFTPPGLPYPPNRPLETNQLMYGHLRGIKEPSRRFQYNETPTSPREINYAGSPFSPTYQYWEPNGDRYLMAPINTTPIPFDPYGIIGTKMGTYNYECTGGGANARWRNNQRLFRERPPPPPLAYAPPPGLPCVSVVREPVPFPVPQPVLTSPGARAFLSVQFNAAGRNSRGPAAACKLSLIYLREIMLDMIRVNNYLWFFRSKIWLYFLSPHFSTLSSYMIRRSILFKIIKNLTALQ